MIFEIAIIYINHFLLVSATYCQYDNSFQLDNGWYLYFFGTKSELGHEAPFYCNKSKQETNSRM